MASAPKIFNIDKFETPKRQIVLDGKTYEIRTLTVQEFIDNLGAAERLQEEIRTGKSSVDLRLSKQIEESCAAIKEAIPTLPLDRIKSLPIEKQVALLEFIRGDLDPDTHASEAAPAEGATPQEGAAAKKPD